MIRPERMMIEPLAPSAAPQAYNSVDLTVTNIAYVGSGLRLIGQTADGVPVQVWLTDLQQASRFAAGQRARASWTRQDSIPLAEGT